MPSSIEQLTEEHAMSIQHSLLKMQAQSTYASMSDEQKMQMTHSTITIGLCEYAKNLYGDVRTIIHG